MRIAAAFLIAVAFGFATPAADAAPVLAVDHDEGDHGDADHAHGEHAEGEHGHGEHEDHGDDPFHHVRDYDYFELPGHKKLYLPEISFLPSLNKVWMKLNDTLPEKYEGSVMGFPLTKFMVLQVAAALLALLVFAPLAIKIRNGDPVRGRFWNFWETVLVFIRDEVVRPTIGDDHAHAHGHGDDAHTSTAAEDAGHGRSDHGHGGEGLGSVPAEHPADRFLPLIWSLFIYILFCNLLGAIPLLGTPSGNINVTAVLAMVVFASVVYCGIKQSGPVGYLKSLIPGMEVPYVLRPILFPMIWVIEAMGLLIKHCVLAVRLFANLMAGHVVLTVMSGFIGVALVDFVGGGFGSSALGYGIVGGSLLGQVFVSLLELFVAFMQAYVFAFLATLFIAGAVHPH